MRPHIIEAAKHIAYDNGAINRLTTEEQVINQMLATLSVYTPEELDDVENTLAHLSDQDLIMLCIGEHGMILTTELVESVLETLFDNM
ncbi:hypothetical protein [Acinetobacter sp.]|uniref:hypothetical protein n=1 Tax=Acinetobacter sp. TaxID=472 RepID=UPI00388DB2DA